MSNSYRLSMKNICIIWLNLNDPDDSTINLLGPTWKAIFVLNDVHQCSELIQLIYEEKAILIVSEGFLQEIVQLVHSMTQIDSIYIYSEEQINVEQVKSNWSKIKGPFSDLSSQCRQLQRFSCPCNPTPISINILPSTRNISDQFSSQFDPTYMWTQLLKELLSEDSNDPRQLEKMFDYLRQKFANNNNELQRIDELQRNYHLQRPIFWYTKEPFMYLKLNEALRMQDMETIIRFGPYVRDLHHDLKQLHLESFSNPYLDTLTVYRGQAMHKADFDRLVANQGGLLSFNCFLSTSTDISVGNCYAESNSMHSSDQNSVAVLFSITVDTSRSGASFARINGISQYNDEQEVLFSTHTIFRTKGIRRVDGNDCVWLIELELTDENDEQLKKITEIFRVQLDHGLPSRYRIAALLKQLKREDQALKLYQELLELANNEEEKAFLYGRIGSIKSNKGDYSEAEQCLKRAISIYEKLILNSRERQFLTFKHAAEIYSAMGTLYCRSKDFDNALSFYYKAMTTDPNFLETYFNIAAVHNKLGQYSQALFYYNMVLEWLKDYPEDHPDVALTHDNIAHVHMLLDNNREALKFFGKALASYEKTGHPQLGWSYSNLGVCHAAMKEYAEADKYFKKALHFYKTSPPNDRELSRFYTRLGNFDRQRKNYRSALEWLNKSLEIMQRTSMDLEDDDFATVYYKQAITYVDLQEYHKAKPLFEKALKIWQQNSSETADVADCYNQMGILYFELDSYQEALSILNKAHEIYKRISHQNPLSFVALHNTMGCVYAKMGAYSKALSCCKDALEIAQEKSCENDPAVQTLRKNMKKFEDLRNQQRGT